MRFRWTLAAIALCAALPAAARDIYVSNVSGDDRLDGRSAVGEAEGGPVRTIGKALRLATAGDRIVVANTPEPYRETVSLIGSRHGGSPIGPLVIEGNGAWLDGTVPIPVSQWTLVEGDVYSYQPKRMGYQQLFAAGKQLVRRPASPADPAPPALHLLQWTFWRGRIYFCTEPGKLPEHYDLSCCGLTTGISLYYVDNVLVRNLTISGFQAAGAIVDDVARGVRFERVVFRSNGRAGFSARNATHVELDRCTADGNGACQVLVEDFARLWLYDCRLTPGEASPAILRRGGQVVERAEPFVAGNSRSLPILRSP